VLTHKPAGKKTFSSLFSKVKEKLAEFEAGQTAGYEKYNKDPSHPLYRGPEPAAAAPAGGVPTAPPVQSQQPGLKAPPAAGSYFEAGPSGTTHQGNTPQIPLGSPGYVPRTCFEIQSDQSSNEGTAANPPAAATPALSTVTASPPGTRPTSAAPDPG
jgi:hypothetical protein